MFTLKRVGGFTLVEFLMVVAVAGMLSAVSVPAVSEAMQRYRLDTASRAIMAEMRGARFAAVAKNLTVRVLFNCPVHENGSTPPRCQGLYGSLTWTLDLGFVGRWVESWHGGSFLRFRAEPPPPMVA